MEIPIAITTETMHKLDVQNHYPLYVAGSPLVGGLSGLAASHLVSRIVSIDPIVSAVYGGIAYLTSALLYPLFEKVITNNSLGSLLKLGLDSVVSFGAAFLAISLYGTKFTIVAAIFAAGAITVVNIIFIFTIAAAITSKANN